MGKSRQSTVSQEATSSQEWIGLYLKLHCPYSTLVSALYICNFIGCSNNRNFNWRRSFFKISHQNRPKTMWKTYEKAKKWCYMRYCILPDNYQWNSLHFLSKNIHFRNLHLVFMPRPKSPVFWQILRPVPVPKSIWRLRFEETQFGAWGRGWPRSNLKLRYRNYPYCYDHLYYHLF